MSLEYNGSPSISGNISLTTLTGSSSQGIVVSGSNTRGGTVYVDFLRAINTYNPSFNHQKILD